MLQTLPLDIWPQILKTQDMVAWFRQGLHLLCKGMLSILFADKAAMNQLWLELFQKYGLTVKPVGPACHEFVRWQKNELKLHRIMERIFVQKQNVFITGGAGVGKSHLLKQMVQKLKMDWEPRSYAICASTGAAAVLIEGVTLHSFSGIGTKTLRDFPLRTILKMMRDESKEKWKNLELLIIDEISMLSPDFLETIDFVAKAIKETPTLPFGGIQVIFIGDFYQLAPVPRKEIISELDKKRKNTEQSTLIKKITLNNREPSKVVVAVPEKKAVELPTYCFETKCWTDAIKPQNCFILDYVFRQNDRQFCALLKSVRRGELNETINKRLSSRVITNLVPYAKNKEEAKQALFGGDEVKPIELHCLNRTADEVNQLHMNKLLSNKKVKTYTLEALMLGKSMDKCVEKDVDKLEKELFDNCLVPRKQVLCIGAQVMLRANLDVQEGLINGSTGVIEGFSRRYHQGTLFHDPVVRFSSGRLQVITQSVYTFGYDLVKHKEGGYLTNPPLSAIKFRPGFVKDAFKPKPVENDSTAKKDKKKRKNKKKKSKWGDSDTEEDEEEEGKKEKEEQNEEDDTFDSNLILKPLEPQFCGIAAIQYPLVLAWAISIHKSQGMSLPSAILNIGQAFAPGQGYVALSRLASLEGMHLYSYHPNNIKTDPKVTQFYLKLEEQQKNQRKK